MAWTCLAEGPVSMLYDSVALIADGMISLYNAAAHMNNSQSATAYYMSSLYILSPDADQNPKH